MRIILLPLIVFMIAGALGLGSVWYLIRGEPPFGAVQVGPWIAWPDIGSTAIDPYMQAIVARQGALPLGAGEGLELFASEDSQGNAIDSACTYAVRGIIPSSRAWTLTAYDAAGQLVDNDLTRSGFTSSEVLRKANGTPEIILSRKAFPGNWLMLPSTQRAYLVLRLYGVPMATMTGVVGSGGLPAIDRLSCP